MIVINETNLSSMSVWSGDVSKNSTLYNGKQCVCVSSKKTMKYFKIDRDSGVINISCASAKVKRIPCICCPLDLVIGILKCMDLTIFASTLSH